jgi:hypothetical protein
MTKAVVVYESMFGNTRRIAEAVAEGIRSAGGDVEVRHVEDPAAMTAATVARLADLVVVGGPTHAFGLSRRRTRADAARRPGALQPTRVGRGLREWLEALPESTGRGRAASAFDTRMARPKVPGSAARAAARRLRQLGFAVKAAPQSFWVEDVAGPLVVGELERAEAWGRSLVPPAPAPPPTPPPVTRSAAVTR